MAAIRKNRPKTRMTIPWVIVWGYIFLLVGCGGSPPNQEQRNPSTVVPAQTASPVPTTIPDTATPVPASTPSATPVPSLPIDESFTDNRNGWRVDSAGMTIGDGAYYHTMDCPDSHVSPNCGTFIRMPFTFPRNFRLELDATILESSGGANVTIAIQVRRSEFEYYYLSYGMASSNYQFSHISQNGRVDIIPETSTDSIHTTAGATNRLGIEVNGASFTPVVNGQELPPVEHAGISAAGDAYLVILVARGHSAELQFDNLTVQAAE